jgi:hypothetical protein
VGRWKKNEAQKVEFVAMEFRERKRERVLKFEKRKWDLFFLN